MAVYPAETLSHKTALPPHIPLPERNKGAASIRLFNPKKMQVISNMMRVQWFMQQMACHPTAWLTSTETLGNTRGSSSLYGLGRGPRLPSAARRDQPPFTAFLRFSRLITVKTNKACVRADLPGPSLLFPRFMKLLLTSDLAVTQLGKNAESISRGKKKKKKEKNPQHHRYYPDNEPASMTGVKQGQKQLLILGRRRLEREYMARGATLSLHSHPEQGAGKKKTSHRATSQTDVWPRGDEGDKRRALGQCVLVTDGQAPSSLACQDLFHMWVTHNERVAIRLPQHTPFSRSSAARSFDCSWFPLTHLRRSQECRTTPSTALIDKCSPSLCEFTVEASRVSWSDCAKVTLTFVN